ncbi:MAG: GNAT family N-acetyltransferase [Nocardioidaceae bacterium]|nr:GNAT family N-acetyltransferase [Nocardioidaceae bacterium]NUS50089.1 GNAT family N-acetyltransferase [Nocardioidaceae bacterium]
MASTTTTPTKRVPRQRWPFRREPKQDALPAGIRPRRPRDIGSCARLLRRAYFEGRFPEHGEQDPRDLLAGDDVLEAWVAESEGEIVGHVALSTLDHASTYRWREVTGHDPDDLVAVSCLFVRPRSRGVGIGATLLGVAASAVWAEGRIPVIEVVSESPQVPALYGESGWRLRATDPRPGKPSGLWLHRFEGPRR